MRLGRRKAAVNAPVVLPEPADMVVVSVPPNARIPARVLERGADSLLLAMTVPTRPMTSAQLEDLVLEYNSPRGRVRLHGQFAMADPADPDLLRMREPRSVEVLQERRYVRIRAARPVLVYCGGDRASIESFTVDVSGGGFLLAGPDTLAMGDEVSFRISIVAGADPVLGTGRVVRIDHMGRRAVAFETISDFDRRRLIRFIFESQRVARRRGVKEEDDGGR